MIGSVAAADRVFGDSGPVYMMRLLTPPHATPLRVALPGWITR